jgi:hypothetical protein
MPHRHHHPHDPPHASLRSAAPDSVLALAHQGHFSDADTMARLRAFEAADHTLLLLVLCATAATLVLALASSLG